MSRPKKEGADYFPHFTSNGKTIFTLESMYGNDGYAFWFKLLEILCSTEGHYYRISNPPEWLFLVSKTRVTAETATAILQTLADLEAIDPDLLHQGVIWCGKMVENLRPVYSKRKVEIPSKPEFLAQKVQQAEVSGAESTQRKVEERKEEKRKEEKAFSSDSDEIRLSELLFSGMLENNPKHKKPNIQKWAEHVDKLIRLDGKTVEEIEQVVIWVQKDSFWRTNILSTQKLRDQFDTLVVRMNGKKQAGQGHNPFAGAK